jgi:hypothetical protein
LGRIVLRVDDAADRLGLIGLLPFHAHIWASLRPSPTVMVTVTVTVTK